MSRDRRCAPRSSCTLNAQTPPSKASSSGPERDDEPRPRKPTLMATRRRRRSAVWSPHVELTPTPQNGPNSWPRMLVHARCEGGLADPRREQVDVGVNGAGGRDQALARDDDGAGADDDVDVVRGVRVAGPSDSDDPSLTDSDAGTDDSEDRVEHDHIGDDDVAGLLGRYGFQPDAVPRGLGESREQREAVGVRRPADADHQARVAQPDPVARLGHPRRRRGRVGPSPAPPGPLTGSRSRNPVARARVMAASRAPGSSSGPSTSPEKPMMTRAPPKGTRVTSVGDAGVEARHGPRRDEQVSPVRAARGRRTAEG